ncbi:CPBP family intramembrane metalloprotease [bacterium]|nr:CPBP family intramembrane metalloprotease [bacterium]
MISFIKQNPLFNYFMITFLFSWSGICAFAFQTGIPASSKQFEETWQIAFLPYLFGPATIGLLFIGLTSGKEGFHDLKSRFLKWKINIGWYTFAILTLPLLVSALLFVFSQFSSEFIPDIITTHDKSSLILQGIAIGFFGGGLLEETGWTGFATPKLKARYGIIKTGLIIGFLWGLWHFLPVLWGCGDEAGKINWSLFLPGLFFYFSGAPAYRVLLVWVHEHTKSLVPVVLMHTSLSASLFFIFNFPQKGFPAFLYYLVLSIALWIIVGIVSRTKSWKMAN